MTTAHRPTWKPQVGGSDNSNYYIPSRSYSSRDLPGYLNLKGRQDGQGSVNDLQSKDFKRDLMEREKQYQQLKQKKTAGSSLTNILTYQDEEDILEQKSNEPEITKKIKGNNEPIKNLESESQENKKQQLINLFPQDADDEDFLKSQSNSDQEENKQKKKQTKNQLNQSQNNKKQQSEVDDDQDSEDQIESKKSNQSDQDEDDEDSSSDSDDENEQLMKEFQKLKEQKELEAKEKLEKKADQYDENQQFEVLKGNPLLVDSGTYSLKRRWYEDTVFKNQSRLEQRDKKTFINDNVRNPFHRKFLSKYIYT